MARSLSVNAPAAGKHVPEPVDDEINAILLAIEEEPVPARLQELALKLQRALTARRAQQSRN
jgi:hypothetical protein